MEKERKKMVKEISRAQVEGLAAKGATEEEIADYLGVSRKTLVRRFGKTIKSMRALFRISLRSKQFELATGKEGDVRMLQWLGRCYLNQTGEAKEEAVKVPIKTYIGIDPDAI